MSKNKQQPQVKPPEPASAEKPPESVPAVKKTGVFVCKGKSITCGTKIKGEGDEITDKDGFDEKSLSDLLKRKVVEIVK